MLLPVLSDRYRCTTGCWNHITARRLEDKAVEAAQLSDPGYPAARIMKKHEWRENTPEGDVRLVCISRHGGKWQLRARLKSDEEWTTFPAIPLEDLETLRELLWNKCQRRRLPLEHLSEVDALIAAAKVRR